MPDTLRTFIAFELPQQIAFAIQKVQEDIRNFGLKMRWVRPENIHLTLKFLGDLPACDVEKVGQAIHQSVTGIGSIALGVEGIGCFPDIKRPRVVWAGITGDTDSLLTLQRKLEDHLDSIGIARENRPFRGHLTIGRVKGRLDPKSLADAINRFGTFESATFRADQLILFKSELKPAGPVYTKLMAVLLGQRA